MQDPSLTVAQYLALEAIAEGGVVGVELARRAAVSPAAVSQLLATLDDRGLLTRVRLDDDRRRQPLALSEHGQAALRAARATLRDGLAQLLDLRPPEAKALTRLLERLQASLGGTPPPPRPRRPSPRPPREPKGHRHPRRHGE